MAQTSNLDIGFYVNGTQTPLRPTLGELEQVNGPVVWVHRLDGEHYTRPTSDPCCKPPPGELIKTELYFRNGKTISP